MQIRSTADRDRDRILAEAQAKATAIRGEADAESAKWLAILDQNPDLAVFLYKLKALEETLKDKSTLILDGRTPPYDLLIQQPAAPASELKAPSLGNTK
jgi:regulator of protease activity HflC (stomatin/prohibitin superfamily)